MKFLLPACVFVPVEGWICRLSRLQWFASSVPRLTRGQHCSTHHCTSASLQTHQILQKNLPFELLHVQTSVEYLLLGQPQSSAVWSVPLLVSGCAVQGWWSWTPQPMGTITDAVNGGSCRQLFKEAEMWGVFALSIPTWLNLVFLTETRTWRQTSSTVLCGLQMTSECL